MLSSFDSGVQTDYDPPDAIRQRLPLPEIADAATLFMMWRSFIAVSVGGMLGCLLRWALAMFLNSYFPTIPPGTLAANLIGCYIIGMAIAFFTTYPHFAPEWRLFVTTGFCGGLTTFSTFSAEVVMLLQSGRTTWALGAVAAHLFGSLLMTFAGIATVLWLKA
jgi:CrcB protein